MEKFIYLQKTKLNSLPKAPGVYTLCSPKSVLYIGKAINIRDRVKNHFASLDSHDASRARRAKTSYRDNLFIQDVSKVGYIKTESDIDALILESKLIKKQQPKYNVMWKDDKKYFYVAITKEKFPRVFLTHQPILGSAKEFLGRAKDEPEYIGPFIEGKAIKRVLQLLRRVFPYYITKKHGAALCQYCHLNLCPGPTPNQRSYKKNIHNLVSVLNGKRTSVLKQLEKEMNSTAKNQDFEKAAILRDQFLSLKRIVSHAQLLSSEITNSPNWNLIEKELQKLFKIKRRISRVEAFDISNIQGTEATGSQVTFIKGVPAKEHYRKYKIHPVIRPGAPSNDGAHSNDCAMMQELVGRRLQHQEWPYPQIMVIDGGKPQLTSAVNALRNSQFPISNFQTNPKSKIPNSKQKLQSTIYKLQTIHVVALAKRHNELFFPKQSKSVLLRDIPQPLENLFLHIRDEAHRFAVAYHHTLRSKTLFNP